MPTADQVTMQQAFDADQLASVPFATTTDLATADSLPDLPDDADKAVIQAEGGSVRWRPDGATTAPTASVGFLLADGESMAYVGGLAALRVIAVDAGAGVNVAYFKDG